ncbi:coiled-coil domain-containing protein 15 [Rhinophrynus dorsalis]
MAPPGTVYMRRKQQQDSSTLQRVKPSRLIVNQAVLAGRNPGAIAAVGAWVESAQDERGELGRALVSAHQVEEQLMQLQMEKQEKLRHFQGEVKSRVNHHARLRKKHQLQKSYDAMKMEGFIVKQSSDAAMHLTPKRNTCTYRNKEVAICSPRSRWVSAEKICEKGGEEEEEEEVDENGNKLFKQHAKTLRKTVKQVRYRLAALKTVESDELTLPGGIWKVSPTRDNPVSRRSTLMHHTEDNGEELLLAGHHDLPVELLQKSDDHLPDKNIALSSVQPFKPTCNRLMKEPYPAGPMPAFSTDYRAALVLRPGVDEEEDRKQRQNQFLMYRRLFMDIEREQVKEVKRQKEHEKKISKIKSEKEFQRQIEEQRLREVALQEKQYLCERNSEMSDLPQEEEKRKEYNVITQKTKEYVRYVEALRAQMKEKIRLHKVELPPLCCCGSDFWDAHPDTCANNCVFYKNPKAYTRALQSVISSREMWDGNMSSRFSACNITSAHPTSFK